MSKKIFSDFISEITLTSSNNVFLKTQNDKMQGTKFNFLLLFLSDFLNLYFRSVYCSKTPLPTLTELQKRLNDWLTKRGKTVSLFHNLKLLNNLDSIEENKENIEVNQDLDKGSYEDLHIPSNGDKDNNGTQNNTSVNIVMVAKSALVDLQNLIIEVN